LTTQVFIAALGTETNQFVPFRPDSAATRNTACGEAMPRGTRRPVHPRRCTVWRKGDRGARLDRDRRASRPLPHRRGTTVRAVYEGFRDEILDGIKAALPIDGVLINVHGAMVADGYDDCEGDLLARARALVGPEVAIGAEFDLHCHLSALMLDSADVLIGYKEYPHTDTMERAAELFAVIADTIDGKVSR